MKEGIHKKIATSILLIIIYTGAAIAINYILPDWKMGWIRAIACVQFGILVATELRCLKIYSFAFQNHTFLDVPASQLAKWIARWRRKIDQDPNKEYFHSTAHAWEEIISDAEQEFGGQIPIRREKKREV